MKAIDKLSEKLLPIAAKMNNQRHLTAVRDGFIVTMPLIMAASLFILLNSVIFSNDFVNRFIDLFLAMELTSLISYT